MPQCSYLLKVFNLFRKNWGHIGYFELIWKISCPYSLINPIQDGLFWDCSRKGGGGKKTLLPKICHTYPAVMNLGAVIPFLKKFQKLYESHETPLVFCWHRHFLPKISKFCYIKKYRYRFHLHTKFIILLTFLESLRDVLINMVTILMVSAKMATPGLFKTKIFWKKDYDVIVSVHDITSPILSRDSNHNVNVAMWPMFGNSSISVREVILASIL